MTAENDDGSTGLPSSEASPNAPLEVRIEKMVYGGEGLARTPDGVLLVPLVMPGERVKVKPEERAKGVRRGHLAQMIEPSPDRVGAACPYFGRCGGCQYQHIRYERQLQIKSEILTESFERIGKLRLDRPVEIVASEPLHYRNRIRLQVEKQGARFQVGYFELLSHKLCAISRCPISAPAIDDVIRKLSAGAGSVCFPDGAAELELFASDSGDAMLATVHATTPPPKSFGDKLRRALPNIQSVCWMQERAGKRAAGAGPQVEIWGVGFIEYRVGEFSYRVSHDAFFQSNRFLLDGLMQAVVEDLKGKWALDLYAGVGLFSVPLAHRFEKVTAVESNTASAQDLDFNLQSNGDLVNARAKSVSMMAEKFLETAKPAWDAIVVDPPRHGLTKPVVEHLARLGAARLAYVSCDPTTLARDVAALAGSGYRIRSVHLADQFPQTYHLESLVHLERDK